MRCITICYSFRCNSYGPWTPTKCDSILIFTSFYNKVCLDITYHNTKMSFLSAFKRTKSKTLRTAGSTDEELNKASLIEIIPGLAPVYWYVATLVWVSPVEIAVWVNFIYSQTLSQSENGYFPMFGWQICGQYDDYFLIVNTQLTCTRDSPLRSVMNTCRVSDGHLWWYYTLYEHAMHRIDNSSWNNYFDKTSYAIPAAPATILFADVLSILLDLLSICFRWIELKIR